MWPFLLDMTKLECKKILRNLELEAYSSIVTVFRAQGELTNEKIEILQELQIILHITIDRHKSELRRAINDEKLYTIAKRLSSNNSNINSKWHSEAKRIIPVLPRLPPNTYYKLLAEQIVEKSKCFLESLAEPSDTELKIDKNLNVVKEKLDIATNMLPKLADKDPCLVYLNEDLTINKDTLSVSVDNIKPSELIAKYLDKKSTHKSNNEIIEKLLENKELREKYEKQLDDLKSDLSEKKKKIEDKTELINKTPIVTTITASTSNKTTPSTTPITTISVNPTNSNQKVILKTLNTGTTLNQTQIKTTDALKSLIMNANLNNNQNNDVKLTTVKQVILTTKANSKVIVVPNNNNNNSSNNQAQSLVNDISSPIHQNLQTSTSQNHIMLSKLTTIPKLVLLKNNNNNNTPNTTLSMQPQSIQSTTNESKSVKIISPISLLLQSNNDKISPEIQQFHQQSIKPIILNNFNYLKDVRFNQKIIDNKSLNEDKIQLNSNQESDLLLNFQNENGFYNLLPSIPPISPALSSTNLSINQKNDVNSQKSSVIPLNCFQDSFKNEIEKSINTKLITLKTEKKVDYESTTTTIDNNNKNLKRKRLDSSSDSTYDTSVLSPTETSSNYSNISTINSSPPNSFETNLNFIKEMLENLNENNLDAEENQLNESNNSKNNINYKTKNKTNVIVKPEINIAFQTVNNEDKKGSIIDDNSKYNNIKRVKFNNNTFNSHLTSVKDDLS